MPYTPEEIEALEKAIATGALKVKYQDREIQYRSLEEMTKILNSMQSSVGKGQKIKLITPQFSKGLS